MYISIYDDLDGPVLLYGRVAVVSGLLHKYLKFLYTCMTFCTTVQTLQTNWNGGTYYTANDVVDCLHVFWSVKICRSKHKKPEARALLMIVTSRWFQS